jgi:hypothetical protein
MGILILILYFLPSILAVCQSKRSLNAIFCLNLLLGWTVIGWIVSLIWALTHDLPPVTIVQHIGAAPVRSLRGHFCERCGNELSSAEMSFGKSTCALCAASATFQIGR